MGKRVLVVDDDPVIRLLITEYLSNFGHSVEVLDNGADCLERLKGKLPDMLVLDLQMPLMNGIQVLENLRNNPSTSDLPVIMLSANEESENVAASSGETAAKFLQKPFNMKEILQMVEK